MMITKVKHGRGIPDVSKISPYQLGFSDEKKHLYIYDGSQEDPDKQIIDIMGWIDAGTGEKVDTLQDFFGEIVWRVYLEGETPVTVDITGQEWVGVTYKDKSHIIITNIVNYGGNIVTYQGAGTTSHPKRNYLMPADYIEWTGSDINTMSLTPIGYALSNSNPNETRYRLLLIAQKHDGSSVDDKHVIKYRMYVDFTDGSVRNR
jgi:hypothetical protein